MTTTKWQYSYGGEWYDDGCGRHRAYHDNPTDFRAFAWREVPIEDPQPVEPVPQSDEPSYLDRLRDDCAKGVVAALAAAPGAGPCPMEVAEWAYWFADALIAERARRKETKQ